MCTIRFIDPSKRGSSAFSSENLDCTCENPQCSKYCKEKGYTSCKHVLAVLLERKEKNNQSKDLSAFSKSNGYKYERILSERTIDVENEEKQQKQYLVKWAPTAGARGGLKTWGYGKDLQWIPEDDLLHSTEKQFVYTGIEEYHEYLSALRYVGLKRINAF